MAYTIMFLAGERVQRTITWDTGLDPAIKYARDHMAIRKADRVEVWDQNDAVVFQYATPVGRVIGNPTEYMVDEAVTAAATQIPQESGLEK